MQIIRDSVFVDSISPDLSIAMVTNQRSVLYNLVTMEPYIDKSRNAAGIFAVGNNICVLERQKSNFGLNMYLYNPHVNTEAAKVMLEEWPLLEHQNLLFDAYNTVTAEDYDPDMLLLWKVGSPPCDWDYPEVDLSLYFS